jgi:hypothetical protein
MASLGHLKPKDRKKVKIYRNAHPVICAGKSDKAVFALIVSKFADKKAMNRGFAQLMKTY